MANVELTMTTNGGLLITTGVTDTLEIDPTNLSARTDMDAAGLRVLIDDNNTPKAITMANFIGELPHDSVVGTNNDSAEITFDDNNANVEVSAGTLLALNNYSDAVGGTNADCYIDNAGLLAPNTSSREVKDNIRDAREDDVERLLALRPRIYNRHGQTADEVGLVAEEVAETWPELVSWKRVEIAATTKENGKKKRRFEMTNKPMGVNLTRLVVPLLKEVQALRARVEALEAR